MIKLYFLLILIIYPVYTQVTQQWLARYNGPTNNFDVAASVQVDNNGNVFTAGTILESSNQDYILLKYNSTGSLLWSKRYNGTGNGNDYLRAMKIDIDGNIIVTGRSTGTGSALEDCVTIKYDNDGNLQWVQRYNGGSSDEGVSLTVDDSGNIYTCGYKNLSAANPDYLVIKYLPDGTVAWLQTYNSASNAQDYAADIKVDIDGNVYVTGSSYVTPDFDYYTIKYNSQGVLQWGRRYHGGVGDDNANALTLDADGNVYVTGKSKGTGTNSDILTIKYSATGSVLWSTRSNGGSNGNDEGIDITTDVNGNIIACGYLSYLFSNENMAVIKYDPSGNILWTYTYAASGSRKDIAKIIDSDVEGNIYVSGTSDSLSNGNVITLRLDQDGNEQWIQNFNGPANSNDEAAGLTIDNSGYVYLTCTSTGIGTGYDIVTIKNAQTVGILPVSNEIPDRFSLGQNYPNPFNPVSKIRFNIKNRSFVTISIYDVSGRFVANLVNNELQAGVYETEIEASNLSSGVYFYKMNTGSFSETRKLVVIK